VAWYLYPITSYVPLYRHREPMEGWYLLPHGRPLYQPMGRVGTPYGEGLRPPHQGISARNNVEGQES